MKAWTYRRTGYYIIFSSQGPAIFWLFHQKIKEVTLWARTGLTKRAHRLNTERCWPSQYFAESSINGGRNWKTRRESSGKNMLKNLLHNLLRKQLNAWHVPTQFSLAWFLAQQTEEPSPAWQQLLGHSRQWSLQDMLGSSPCQNPSITSTAARLLLSRRWEMRECKGVKILLAIWSFQP